MCLELFWPVEVVDLCNRYIFSKSVPNKNDNGRSLLLQLVLPRLLF